MKKAYSFISFILIISIFSCQSNVETRVEKQVIENEVNNDIKEYVPRTCLGWIMFYKDTITELETLIDKKSFKVQWEGPDEYNSPNKLKGKYILKDQEMPIEKIGVLAKYLAYKLSISDHKKNMGIEMDCEKRKIQVVIARNRKLFDFESWAVVYNIYPKSKQGDLIILDIMK